MVNSITIEPSNSDWILNGNAGFTISYAKNEREVNRKQSHNVDIVKDVVHNKLMSLLSSS